MAKSLEIVPAIDCDGDDSWSSGDDGEGACSPPETATRLERYLPLSLVTTAVVVIVPVAVVALVVRSRNPLLMVGATALAMALSVALSSAGAALWQRWPGSRDLVFADLMLWGWCRRYWMERRLGRARTLYESARRAGPSLSIELIERLTTSLQARDASTQGHSQRVARHAGRIAKAMRLPTEQRAKIRTAAAVHDVGKLYTPRAILNNPGFLSDEEYRILKRHPVDGADMLAGVGDPEITAMVRHHHERLDGSGYPDGLAGEEIPLGARIIAVADTFDAISSDRAYRSARTHKKALDILSEESGSQLDGAVVAAFVQTYTARRPVARLAFASAGAQRVLAWLQTSSSTVALGGAGIIPLVPAVGAAGVLALAHGPHDGALAGRRQYPQASARRANTLAAFPVATPLERALKPRAGTGKIVLGPGPSRPHQTPAPPTPTAPGSGSTPTSSPAGVPTVETHTAVGEAPAATGAPPAAGGGAPASSPANTPSDGQPPVTPTSLPAVPASVPAVTVAAGEVSVATPAVSVPTKEVSIATPAVSVPTKEVSIATPVVSVSAVTPTIDVPAVKLP
jgi:HD-GYP domain-containing protein (c-di-GMP phosphodiesterase class II)